MSQFRINNETGQPIQIEEKETPDGVEVTLTLPEGQSPLPVNQKAVQFERALQNLVGEFAPQLTVTEAVGILELAKGHILKQVL